jgi:preprotein translocase subunit SecD
MNPAAAIALVAALYACPALAEPAVLCFGEGAGRLEIATSDIAGIAVARQPQGAAVHITIGTAGTAAIADWTAARFGQEIPVLLCGEVLMRPRLMEAIRGGELMISSDSPATARALAARLRAADCPGG